MRGAASTWSNLPPLGRCRRLARVAPAATGRGNGWLATAPPGRRVQDLRRHGAQVAAHARLWTSKAEHQGTRLVGQAEAASMVSLTPGVQCFGPADVASIIARPVITLKAHGSG